MDGDALRLWERERVWVWVWVTAGVGEIVGVGDRETEAELVAVSDEALTERLSEADPEARVTDTERDVERVLHENVSDCVGDDVHAVVCEAVSEGDALADVMVHDSLNRAVPLPLRLRVQLTLDKETVRDGEREAERLREELKLGVSVVLRLHVSDVVGLSLSEMLNDCEQRLRDSERDALGEHVRTAECVQDADPVPLRLLVSLPVLVYDRVGAWVVVNDGVAVRLQLAVMHVLPDADSDAEAEPVSVDEGLLVVHDAEGVVLRLMLRVCVGHAVPENVREDVREREAVALAVEDGLYDVEGDPERVRLGVLNESVGVRLIDWDGLTLELRESATDRVGVALRDCELRLGDADGVRVADAVRLKLGERLGVHVRPPLGLCDRDTVALPEDVVVRVRVRLEMGVTDGLHETEGDPVPEGVRLGDEAVPETLCEAEAEGVDRDSEAEAVLLCDSEGDGVDTRVVETDGDGEPDAEALRVRLPLRDAVRRGLPLQEGL